MLKKGLRLIGLIYGLLGLCIFSILLYVLVYGEIPPRSFLGAPLLSLVFFFLMAYSLWKLKKWGRYLVVTVNGLWVSYFVYEFIDRWMNEAGFLDLSRPLFLSSMVFVFIPSGIILFCLHPKVKALMQH